MVALKVTQGEFPTTLACDATHSETECSRYVCACSIITAHSFLPFLLSVQILCDTLNTCLNYAKRLIT